jgi:hypothetical protein
LDRVRLAQIPQQAFDGTWMSALGLSQVGAPSRTAKAAGPGLPASRHIDGNASASVIGAPVGSRALCAIVGVAAPDYEHRQFDGLVRFSDRAHRARGPELVVTSARVTSDHLIALPWCL